MILLRSKIDKLLINFSHRGRPMRRSVLVRYIITYSLMALVPIAVMSSYFLVTYTQNTRERINIERQATFRQAVSRVDTVFGDIRTIGLRISGELDAFVELDGLSSPRTNPAEIFTRLYMYEQNAAIPLTIGFYVRGEADIYLNSGIYRFDYFEQKFALDMAMAYFFLRLNTSRAGMFFELTGNIEDATYITGQSVYMMPLPYLSASPGSVAVFMIPQDSILNTMQDIMGTFEGNVFILSRMGEPVLTHINLEQGPGLRDIMSLRGVGAIEMNQHGDSYIALRGVSEANGFTYVVVMKSQEYFGTRLLSIDFIWWIALTIIIFVAVAVLVAKFNYRPINQLLEDFAGRSEKPRSANEFTHIRELLKDSHTQNVILASRVSAQSRAAREQLFTRLIHGGIQGMAELDYYAECAGLSMDYSCYFAMVCSIPNSTDRRRVLDSIIEIGALTLPDIHIQIVEIGLEKRIIFICCCYRHLESAADCAGIAQQAADYYKATGIHQTIWGVGQPKTMALEIYTSYLEATAALQSAVIGDSHIIYTYYPNNSAGPYDMSKLTMEVSFLMECIKHGDAKSAQAAFEKALSHIRDQAKGSYLFMQMGLFELLNTILKMLRQQGIDIDINQYIKSENFSSLQEFQSPVTDLLKDSCEEIALRHKSRDTVQKRKLLLFIRENYMNPEFSHDFLSEKLDMSKYQINAILKEDTGYSMSQYTAMLRHEEVKRRLIETSDPIKDIVTGVGYIDTANFQRKFKQVEGVTPGQFRELNRK